MPWGTARTRGGLAGVRGARSTIVSTADPTVSTVEAALVESVDLPDDDCHYPRGLYEAIDTGSIVDPREEKTS